MGPRTKVCACGYVFIGSIKTESLEINIVPVQKNTDKLEIIIPAGKCPVNLDKGVDIFVDGLYEHSKAKGVRYLPSVYTYWAGSFVDRFSDEGKSILNQIKNKAKEKQNEW